MDAAPEIKPEETGTSRFFRRALLLLFLLGGVGTGAELALLEHTESAWQWTPLVLIGVSLAVLLVYAVGRFPVVLRAFQYTMALFVASGLIGLYQHYSGNAEFELEMYPGVDGLRLVWQSLQGATPALAPGMMIELGLLGWAYTFRHPAWASRSAGA